MKFINYLQSISGVAIYPLISLLIFFLFFTLLTIWVIKVDKEYISMLENLPMSEENDTTLK